MTERAQKIYDSWEDEYCRQKPFYEHRALASAIRETINQLQKETTLGAVIMCEDMLELCEELEKLK